MENCVVNENISNDFLPQSYSQSIERITGSKDHILDFQLPKELLEVREKIWQNLFDKYTEEMSDEIELNVNTLEPEEDEEEEEDEENDEKLSKEDEYRSGQRAPLRKPAFLIQYWIDTGNPPYNILLDKTDLSETGSSLSEKEVAPTVNSMLSTIINENVSNTRNLCDKRKNDSSGSSVDTAVYILSNANITKKADTIAIIEGAKYTNKSSRDSSKDTDILSDVKTVCIGTTKDGIMHNDNNVNTDISRNIISAEYVPSETHDQQTTDAVILSDAIQPTSQSSCCEETDKNDMSVINQRGLDVRNMDDIVSIFQQFDKTSKRLNQDTKTNDNSSENEMSKKDIFYSHKQVSANDIMKEIENDTNLTLLNRKKLYTGRNSPVDLMLTKRHSMNKISETKKTLHPALDPECTIKKKLLSIHKGKNKRSLSHKSNSDLKMSKSERKKKHSSIFKKNTANTDSIDDKIVTNGSIHNSTIDTFFNSLSDNDTNIPIKNKTLVQDLASLNLNPVVLLERIVPSFKQYTFDSIKNSDTMQKDNNKYLNDKTSSKLNIYNVENLDSETVDSDESTILICKCKKNILQCTPSSNQSFLYSTIENDSISSATKDDKTNTKDELSNPKDLKSADINESKELFIALDRLSRSQYLYKNHTHATEEPQDLNMSDVTREEEILDSSNMHSSNLREIANSIENVKFPEIRIVLERLPANLYVKRSNNVSNISNSPDGKNISHNISAHNNKTKSQIRTKIPVRENIKTRNSVQITRKVDTNDSLNISNVITEHENQTLDKVESNSISRYENHVNRVKRRRYSVFTSILSDEDDFVQLIRGSQKRLKTSIDNETSKIVERNSDDKTKLVGKTKDSFDENPDLEIHSSKQAASKEINRYVNKKNEPSGIKIKKSFCNNFASTDLSQMNNSEIFSILSNEADNNVVENSDKHRKRKDSSLNLSRKVDNDNKKRSSIINRNKIDSKDNNRVVLFQTKMFHTDSSDSERSNSYTTSNRKTVMQVSMRRSSQYYDCTNKKTFFDHSVTKKYNQKDSNSLNSSVANRICDMITRSTSISNKKAKVSERFANGEFNDSINSEISNAARNVSAINNVADAPTRKETHSWISSRTDNLSNTTRNKQIFEKSKSSVAIQQKDAKSIKLLKFQTKSYYDSDSSESS